MPIVSFLAVVGGALLSLIYFAEDVFGPPHQLAISTNFHGLPKPFKAGQSVQVLTVREAPTPAPAAYEQAFAQAPRAVEPQQKVAQASKSKKKKTVTKIARPPRGNSYAQVARDSVTRVW